MRTIPYKDQHPYFDGEPLLIEDHASPVGFKVPSVPDYEIDPGLADQGSKCLSLQFEFAIGIIMAAVIGGGIIYLAFTSTDEELIEELTSLTGDFF